jgi:hypothetical protein
MNNNNNRLSSNKISYPRGSISVPPAFDPVSMGGRVLARFEPLVTGLKDGTGTNLIPPLLGTRLSIGHWTYDLT